MAVLRGARKWRHCRWTPEHERLRAAAILALLAVPFARHADVAAAVGRSRRTIERWINRGVYFPAESLAVLLAELCRFDLLNLRAVGLVGCDPRPLGELLADAAGRRLTIRGAGPGGERGRRLAGRLSDSLPRRTGARPKQHLDSLLNERLRAGGFDRGQHAGAGAPRPAGRRPRRACAPGGWPARHGTAPRAPSAYR